MVDRVHGDPADGGPDAQPAAPARLAQRDVLVIQIADLADGGVADLLHAADLAGGELDLHPAGVLGQKLRRAARAAHQLTAAPGLQLDVVDGRAQGDVLQRQRVPDQNVGRGAVDDRLAHREAARGDDIALVPVGVLDQRDARRTVRVVLDARHLSGDVLLVAAEVDDAVRLLVPAPAVPYGDPADVVASSGAFLADRQRLVRSLRGDVVVGRDRHEAPARCRRIETADSHDALLHRLEILDRLLARLERHVGLLPVGAAPLVAADALALAPGVLRTDARHLHLEQRLDRLTDLHLVGATIDPERQDRPLLLQERRLLGDQRRDDDLVRTSHGRRTSATRPAAASVRTTVS